MKRKKKKKKTMMKIKKKKRKRKKEKREKGEDTAGGWARVLAASDSTTSGVEEVKSQPRLSH